MPITPTPPEQGWTIFANWGAVEWLVATAWPCGLAVVVFLWRLTLRVAMLDHDLKGVRQNQTALEVMTEKRHEENTRGREELMNEVREMRRDMTTRMDNLIHQIFESRRPPRGQ